MNLTVGDSAPDFDSFDQFGKKHRLSDYFGSWVILYFYPKDDTPGCTAEACGIRDKYQTLAGKSKIFGVSADSAQSHLKFSEKYNLPFPLLSDSDKKIISAYGADGIILPKRTTFLISPDGVIAQIYEKVSPKSHADQLLSNLTILQKKF